MFKSIKYLQDVYIIHKIFSYLDYYKECTELILLLLREVPDRGVHWRKPGAFHLARWMSSVIYAAKMYLFRDSMGYNEETTVKLREIHLFNGLKVVVLDGSPTTKFGILNVNLIDSYSQKLTLQLSQNALQYLIAT